MQQLQESAITVTVIVASAAMAFMIGRQLVVGLLPPML